MLRLANTDLNIISFAEMYNIMKRNPHRINVSQREMDLN